MIFLPDFRSKNILFLIALLPIIIDSFINGCQVNTNFFQLFFTNKQHPLLYKLISICACVIKVAPIHSFIAYMPSAIAFVAIKD